MLSKGVTIRGLEVFEALAATGSVAQAAVVTGLSQPAVSQQLRNLETALATDLIDHGKRPMRLTPAGQSFLARAETALSQLRLAQSELTVMDLAHLSALAIGVIDDFENDLTPRLVNVLAESLTRCKFTLTTAPSHRIIADIESKRLHLAISASDGKMREGVLEYPLARDPFILVAPRGVVNENNVLSSLNDLPFLRYEREQLISRQIEGHLARQKMDLADRFEIGSHLALMSMVARRIGWAVTTPFGYMRAGRIHEEVEAFALPFAPFSRQISLYASADWAGSVPQDVAQTMRRLMQSHMINPALARLPWLAGELRLLEG